jgi:hypothetical protein
MLVIRLVTINVIFSQTYFPLVDRNMPFNKTYTVVVFGHGINNSVYLEYGISCSVPAHQESQGLLKMCI